MAINQNFSGLTKAPNAWGHILYQKECDKVIAFRDGSREQHALYIETLLSLDKMFGLFVHRYIDWFSDATLLHYKLKNNGN